MTHFSRLLLAAVAALVAPTVALAQSTLGYTTGSMGRTTVCHYGNSRSQGLAIRLSHDKLQPLAGQTIASLTTAFGSANAVTDKKATLFFATGLGEAPFYEQSYTIASANRWATIALDQPYVITGQEPELVVGYRLTATSDNIPEALQTDHTNDLRDCCYAWDGNGWADLYGSGLGAPNLYLNLAGSVAFTDGMLGVIDCSANYYLATQSYQHRTHLFNFGTEPIHSLDITLTVNGEPQHVSLSGLNIPQYGMYNVDLPALTSGVSGSVSLDVAVRANDTDETCAADNAFQTSAFFYPANMERSVLVEEFTGMTCGNCPEGQRGLRKAVEASGLQCVEIMHHAGYAADFWSSDADFDYTWYYGTTSTYAPAAMINRLTCPGATDVPVFNIGFASAVLQYSKERQPYVSLALQSAYDEATRQVDVTLDILAHNHLPGATLLNAYLIQDGIVGYQANGGTDYVHNGLLRKVLTGNSWGLLLPDRFTMGESEQWTCSFTLPDAIQSDFWTPALLTQSGYTADLVTFPTDPAHMRIVAYIASYDPDNIRNNVVYNCIEVPLVNGAYRQAAMDATALEVIHDEPQRAISCDLSGRPVSADAAQLPAGFYIINGQKRVIR